MQLSLVMDRHIDNKQVCTLSLGNPGLLLACSDEHHPCAAPDHFQQNLEYNPVFPSNNDSYFAGVIANSPIPSTDVPPQLSHHLDDAAEFQQVIEVGLSRGVENCKNHVTRTF